MNTETLKAVLEEASALTSSLPEGIQPAAFSKAFDVLLEQHGIGTNRLQRTVTKRTPPRQYESRAPVSTSRPRRAGPKFVLGQLIDSGYFATSRGLPEIQAYLKDSHGHDYGSNELSISLLRLIRHARLSREKNLAGQYEYWAPGRGSEEPARAENLQHTKAHARLLTDGKGAMK
jgi:hypothetical protein